MLLLLLGLICLILAILMLYSYLVIFPRYEAHWKATEHELTSIWTHINSLEYSGSIEEMEDFMRKEGLMVDE